MRGYALTALDLGGSNSAFCEPRLTWRKFLQQQHLSRKSGRVPSHRPAGTLRPLEDVLALLTRAGFSGADALHICRALFGFLDGHVLNELQELVDNPDETDDLLRLGLHRLPIGEFPLLRSLAPVLAAYDGAAELERGLDILLTGLATALPPPDRARSSGQAV